MYKKNSMSKMIVSMGIIFLGLLLFSSGLVFIILSKDVQGIMVTLPYICIGVGAGAFGLGVGNIIIYRVLKNNPDLAKREKINQEDERNIAINNRAKAKSYDIMIYVFSALLLAFALMGSNLREVLLLVGAYLFFIFINLFYFTKYQKEM